MSDSLPITDFVEANISIASPLEQGRDFGLPISITPENTPGIDQDERVREYTSMSEISEDWNSTDEVYIMSQTAFNQKPRVERVLIGVRFTTDQAGFLQCASLGTDVDVNTFKAVTDGSFKISIDGAAGVDIVALDFLAAVDLPAVAGIITAALTGAVCTWDETYKRFKFTSAVLGDVSEIKNLEAVDPASGTDISGADFLNGLLGSSSRVVKGLKFEGLTDEFDNILKVNDEAYFMSVAETGLTDILKIELAEWVETLDTAHQFFIHSNDQGVIQGLISSDIGSALQGLGVERSFTQYSGFIGQYPEVSALARAATVNFGGSNTSLTLKYTLPSTGISSENGSGIEAPVFRSQELRVVNDKNVNVYALVGQRGRLVSEAVMSNGTYQDELHFSDWLRNTIETNVANILFNSGTKIPFTDSGLAQLEAGIISALEQGVRNGGLAETQDENGQYQPAYIVTRVPVREVDPADKQNRIYKGFFFIGYLSGAVHTVKPIIGVLTTIIP